MRPVPAVDRACTLEPLICRRYPERNRRGSFVTSTYSWSSDESMVFPSASFSVTMSPTCIMVVLLGSSPVWSFEDTSKVRPKVMTSLTGPGGYTGMPNCHATPRITSWTTAHCPEAPETTIVAVWPCTVVDHGARLCAESSFRTVLPVKGRSSPVACPAARYGEANWMVPSPCWKPVRRVNFGLAKASGPVQLPTTCPNRLKLPMKPGWHDHCSLASPADTASGPTNGVASTLAICVVPDWRVVNSLYRPLAPVSPV